MRTVGRFPIERPAVAILGACNIIVVQIASRDGVTVSMKDFVKAGLPVTAVTLVLSTALIALLVPA